MRSGSASGLGDIVLSAAYSAYYNPATTLGMDLTGKLKLPTADESKALGRVNRTSPFSSTSIAPSTG